MPTRFNLPHINITPRITRRDFTAPNQNQGGGGIPRDRRSHGERLSDELQAALRRSDETRQTDERLEPIEGAFLEVEITRGTPADILERKREKVLTGATKLEANDNKTIALFVPNDAREVFDRILQDYTTGDLTPAGKPQRENQVAPIENIRAATFNTYWTDEDSRLPNNPHELIWWELWCVKDGERDLEMMATTLGLRLGSRDQRLIFPEAIVIPVYGSKAAIELMLFSKFTIMEIRRVSDTPHFYVNLTRREQGDWANELAERTIWPGENAPAVCLLDTGVNRAHSLIEPALSPTDISAVNLEWGVTDMPPFHGTEMSGIALHGDLTVPLGDISRRELSHRLESIKIIPPNAFDATNPQFYGSVTQSAISLAEIARPDRERAFCLAITNDGVSGRKPTTWSSAIDQATSGYLIGDDANNRRRRLVFVSTGNTPNEMQIDRIAIPASSQIEDPGQSWNALTVGGYTDKVRITEPELEGYVPYVEAGDVSPYSRTSVEWNTKAPFKPEIVMEAGNRAISPQRNSVASCASLGVLTTGPDVGRNPLVPFEATSAATAAAARLGARLIADHPDLWPESIRALIIHSAEWTEKMKTYLNMRNGVRERAALLRYFGYGVPDYDRASRSATNHLALISQAEIQPYKSNPRGLKDSHFYKLPWPKEELAALQEREVRLKITLSYFIEPNPGVSSATEPYRYQSFGLRFDLKRRDEPMTDFVKRVNAHERENANDKPYNAGDHDNWMFGPDSRSAGSLHCDVWSGPAVHLAARDMICIRPIGGWWRNRASVDILTRKTRYALVMTLETDDAEVDFHTPISTIVNNRIDTETPFVVV